MEFFVPEAEDENEAEEVWEGTKKWAEENFPNDIASKKIYKIKFEDGKDSHEARVGSYARNGEKVVAIFESSDTYLVCTRSRGVAQGMPILVGDNQINSVIEFE